jgi:aminocarboxymuconate-semialdehyde decarboxylase
VYDACERLGAALFVHPWDMMAQDKMKKYWLPWLVGMPAEVSLAICSMIFGGVFEKFPRLRVAFAHGGGAFPMTVDRIQHGFQARPDLVAVDCKVPPKDYLGHFWVDSLVHGPEPLQMIQKLFGPQKICLGTDYPFPLGEEQPGALIESSGLTQEDQQWMYHGAALEWLGMKKHDFV